jgi:hypothetical protein
MTNRRTFTKLFAATLSLACLPLTGCSNTTIADFVSLIGRDAAALATYFNQGSLASQILSLASQIAVDVTNWQSGSSAQLAIQAIQDLINLIATIPAVGPYVPLVDLVLSALSGLLLLLPPSAGAMVPHNVNGHAVAPFHYPDASKKSMTAAKNSFDSSWSALTATAPLAR